MTQDNNKSQNLFLPIVLALLLVFVAFVVVWVMMIRPSTISLQEAAETQE